MLSALENWMVSAVETFGYIGITLMVLAETVFPPLPSEAILPAAGFTASRGDLTLLGVIIAATVGSVAGALVLYLAGSWFGRERLYALVGRYGRYALLKEADLDKANGWFERHSGKAVFFGRLVPGVRSLISIPAGMTRMPLATFLLYTIAGSALWNSILIGAGYALGNRWETVEQYAGYLQYAVILGGLAAIAGFVWLRLRANRRQRPDHRSTELR